MGVCSGSVRRDALERARGNAHSLSLDLEAQWRGLESNGQWRFTPPTHVLAALDQALAEHAAEGGIDGRGARYRTNHRVLVDGMADMGFATLLPRGLQAPIISPSACRPIRRSASIASTTACAAGASSSIPAS